MKNADSRTARDAAGEMESLCTGMTFYLSEFRPLAERSTGRDAVAMYNLPPFIDASCRREPDLESEFPSITALCREGRLASIVGPGDVVGFMTKELEYPLGSARTRRLVAVLRVRESWLEHRPRRGLDAHAAAAKWYGQMNLPVPSNCMVNDGGRKPLNQTDRYKPDLDDWDAGYLVRAKRCGAFHACEKEYCDIQDPPRLANRQLNEWFKCIPNPREPESLSPTGYAKMLRWLAGKAADAASRQRLETLAAALAKGGLHQQPGYSRGDS
jgi:hypothetical protein